MSTKHPQERYGGARDETTIIINLTREQLMTLIKTIKEKYPTPKKE